MSMEAASNPATLGRFEQLRLAREIFPTEGQAFLTLSERLSDEFCRAVETKTVREVSVQVGRAVAYGRVVCRFRRIVKVGQR